MSQVSPVPARPVPGSDDELGARAVNADPQGDWFLALSSKIPPKEIDSILRMALAGNLWQAYQVVQRMRDSWPMFKKCEFELRSAISNSTFVVHPYALPGQEPSDSAKEKAELVRRCIDGFKPDRFAEEGGFRDLVFDITDAVLNGVAIVELIWDEGARDEQGNKEKRIKSAAFVHPRHYSFRADGTVGVAPSETTNWLQFPSQQAAVPLLNNPSKFIVAKAKSKSGTPLGAGMMRPLALMWPMVVYGRDWMMQFAQKYGNPFMDIPYQSGISEAEVAKFQRLASQAANQGWCVHPNTGEVKVTPAQGMGASNAHVELTKMADEACQILLLGQTLTSNTPSSGGGSRAQGAVHENVRQERIEGLLKWVAGILTEQFAESILVENYGDSEERPTIAPDLTRPLDALEQAQFLTALSACTVPLPVEDTYKKLGITAPAAGDQVLISGKIGLLGDTETEIEANPVPPPPPSYDENGIPTPNADGTYPAPPIPPVPAADKGANGNDLTKARFSGVQLRTILAKLPEHELAEVNTLVLAAKHAPHQNGELKLLQKKLTQLTGGRYDR